MSQLLLLYLDQFLIFVLVLARIGTLVMTLPVFGSAGVPMQVRGFLAVAIALLIAPLHWGMPVERPQTLLDLAVLIGRESILGLALGSAVMLLLSGMQLAGQVIGQMSGLSLADVFNPTFDTSVPIFSLLLEHLALAIFFLLGGHRDVLDALLASFEWMPPGAAQLPSDLTTALSSIAAQSFETGLRASAPVMISMLLAILIVALISRTLPQLNSIAVGMNFNSLIVLAVLTVCIGSAAYVFQNATPTTIDAVRELFMAPAVE